MLVIKIELWKHGNPEDITNLGVMLIKNNGSSGTLAFGNYDFVILKGKDYEINDAVNRWKYKIIPKSWLWKAGYIHWFDRIKKGPWHLLQLCLNSIISNNKEE